ncbi:MAG: hypothetical protein ABEJ68_10815 [Halobacteriaceae archaeon]
MSTTDDRSMAAAAGESLAATLRDAAFAHVVAHADGDALASAALIARALEARGTPYQVSTAATAGDAARRVADSDEDAAVVAVRLDPAGATESLPDGLTTPAAFDTATSLADVTGEMATLALAGVAAGGGVPERDAPAAADRAPVERRPGVAIPTADLVDGLAHSTLVHAGFSGDTDAAGAALADLDLPAELDAEDRRRLASVVALDASAGESASADAMERALRPLAPGGPFATVGGYADVLDAVARTAPGTALAAALGHDVRTAALDAWREAATAVHDAVRTAQPTRHSGLVVADVGDAPVWTAARLLRDARSPEPAALAVGTDEVALAAEADADARLASVVGEEVVAGRGTLAYAQTPEMDASELTAAVRGTR